MGTGTTQPRRLTQEEMNRIMSLPVRTFRVGGELRSGFFDEETMQFYESVDGRLTGKVARVNPPASKPAPAADDEKSSSEASADAPEEPDEETARAAKKKKRLMIGGIAGGAVVLLLVAALFMGGDSATDPGQGGENPDPGIVTSEVHVVQVVKDLLPGHVLTPEDVQECVIDANAYNEAVLYGRNFCTYDTLDKLVGNYLSEYIPANQYLEQDSIRAASPFGINPWGSAEQGTTFITVPISPDMAENPAFGFGSVVDLTVRRTVSSQVAVGDDPGYGDIPGVTHTSTMGTTSRTEEITISGLCVCDVLNSDNESLYEQYAAYMGIPLGNRLDYLSTALTEDETLWNKLTPAFVRVRVTDAQSVAIGDLSDNDTAISLQDTNGQAISTDAQAEFASEGVAIKTTLYQAKAWNEQKAAEELADLQQRAGEVQTDDDGGSGES